MWTRDELGVLWFGVFCCCCGSFLFFSTPLGVVYRTLQVTKALELSPTSAWTAVGDMETKHGIMFKCPHH